MNTMKKLLYALTACCLCTVAVAQTKLGHIDRSELMRILPDRPGAEDKLKKFAGDLQTKLQAMEGEYKTKLTTAQENFEKMTETEKAAAQRELGEMEQRIVGARENAQEDLAKMEQELMAPMLKATDDAIKAVGAEGNFTYIFDTSIGAVLYFDKGEDILPLVKKKLNITAP